MYKVIGTEIHHIKLVGNVIYTHSPVSCDRTSTAFIEAAGEKIVINDHEFPILAVEMYMPGRPLEIGEPIGILVDRSKFPIPMPKPEKPVSYIAGTIYDTEFKN